MKQLEAHDSHSYLYGVPASAGSQGSWEHGERVEALQLPPQLLSSCQGSHMGLICCQRLDVGRLAQATPSNDLVGCLQAGDVCL